MGARNNRPSAKGKNNKKKLPRWLIITAVVAGGQHRSSQ